MDNIGTIMMARPPRSRLWLSRTTNLRDALQAIGKVLAAAFGLPKAGFRKTVREIYGDKPETADRVIKELERASPDGKRR